MAVQWTRACLSLAAVGFAVAFTGPAIAQFTPGAIPDPSSYQGSMELQRREQERDNQIQQQQQQQQQQYQRPTPQYGGSSAPAQPAAPTIDWAKRPPLPAARNALLGRWHPTEVQTPQVRSDDLGVAGLLGPGVADAAMKLLGGMLQGGCDEAFGKGVLEFRPTTLVSIGSDGRETIKNHVQYRADSADVVVLPQEAGSISAVVFRFEGKNKVAAFPPGCTMVRVDAGTAAAAGAAGRPPTPPPAPSSSLVASLDLQVGAASPGNFTPIAGATFYIVAQDPDAALIKAGFTGTSPIDAWFQVCRTNQDRCDAGLRAMTAGALGTVRTDTNGNAHLPPLRPGRYYIVGQTHYQGKSLLWHRPVNVQPGPNSVFLDQTNGSLG